MLANTITVARMVLIVPFAACFFIDKPWAISVALAVFVVAAITDFLDGYIARRTNSVTSLGTALDPIADKMLVAVGLLLIVMKGWLSPLEIVGVIAIYTREFCIGGLREGLLASGSGSIAVSKVAKLKTTLQLVAVGLLMAAAGPFGGHGGMTALATIVFYAAVALTIISGIEYTQIALQRFQALEAKKHSPVAAQEDHR